MSLLVLENVDASYGLIKVLSNISLHVEEREIVSVVGPNSAGKTTLLKAISGLHEDKEGKIEFNGEKVDSLPVHEIVKKGISHVLDAGFNFPLMTVKENIEMGLYSQRNISKKLILEKIDWLFSLFPVLEQRTEQFASSLSGGEQKMLAIAMGLVRGPKLVMLDEPSAGLAPIINDKIFETVKKINETGTTILLLEQDVHKSLSISSRGYILESGCIVMEGIGPELLKDQRIKASYLGM